MAWASQKKRKHVQFMHSTIDILQRKQTHVCELAPHAFPWQHCSLTYCRNLGDSSKDPSFVRSRGRVIPYSSAAAAADKFGAIPYSSAAAAADKFGVAQFKAFQHMLCLVFFWLGIPPSLAATLFLLIPPQQILLLLLLLLLLFLLLLLLPPPPHSPPSPPQQRQPLAKQQKNNVVEHQRLGIVKRQRIK